VIFEALYGAVSRNELLLVDGGFCHWHLRKDGQITICEIIATRKGAGREMLGRLGKMPALCIVAKCPADLPSNGWYAHMGFYRIGEETTKTGRTVNVWRMGL
jgi:hypothetical protein